MSISFGRTNRRQALRLGASGMIAGLSLPNLLHWQATAATDAPAPAKSCIFIFLEGGPSTIDMWDLKPDAPDDIRGPYKPIATNVPGTLIGEHLPRCAKIADKYTILRSHSHNDNGHTTGYHYTMTGYKADFADGTNSRKPNNVLYPSVGSVVAKELGQRGPLPPYITLPHPMTSGGPGFLGAEYAPFVVEADPVLPDFEVKDLQPLPGLSAARRDRRRQLLDQMDTVVRDGRAGVMATYYQKAADLMSAPAARQAFDIAAESAATRDRYGHTTLGQCCLLARRLVEAGSRFIGIDHSGWDTHFTQFPSLEKDLIPAVDLAFSALVSDLHERGLLNDTLVVMMGEMGRTPRINNRAGRDHWSMAQSVLFAGGGTKPGVLGATDKTQTAPTTEPVGVNDILHTLFRQLGVDTQRVYQSPVGRPVPVAFGGKLIDGLV